MCLTKLLYLSKSLGQVKIGTVSIHTWMDLTNLPEG